MYQAFTHWLRQLDDAFVRLDVAWPDLLAAGLILAAFAAATFLFSRVIFRLLRRAARLSDGSLDDRIVAAARAPVIAYIILLGCYLALTIPLTLPAAADNILHKATALAAVIIGAILINAIGAAALRWFEAHFAVADTAARAGS